MKLQKFVKGLRRKKVNDLMGVTLDIVFLIGFLKNNNEDKLREELATEERKKDVNQKTGKIIKDWRDMTKIQKLNIKINRIGEVTNQKLGYEDLKLELIRYVRLIDEMSPTTRKELEILSKI